MKDLLLGSYRILGDLGSGGMGKVYLAEVERAVAGLEMGRRVALKVIHPHLLETSGFFKRFLREAEIGRTVDQANVVRCFDCDSLVVEGRRYDFLVMEYVEGQTLRELLNELERVPEELCRHIGREVAKGLRAIHEAGVIHRDMKPENVLITEEHVVKVMDLGVARLQDEAIRLSQSGTFVGSMEYAAPEQFREGGDDLDGRADLHGLGLLLYEMSTGRHPFRADDAPTILRRVLDEVPEKIGRLNPQLSPFFEEVVYCLLQKDRNARMASAADVVAVLEEGEKSAWWRARAQALRLETKRPLRRIRIPRETALYGREQPLAELTALYERVKAGDGRVVLIDGEAGIGKTRLVDEFVHQLQREGEDVNFLFGSYPPGGAATAAGAFSTAYREHFGSEGLPEVLQEYLTVTPLLVPSFAALLRGDATPTGAQPLTKDSLQTVFVHATRGLAAERPTIVLIDDLHFAPEDGRALFASLAVAVPGQSILLIGAMRPGVPEEWIAHVTRLEHATSLSLARLGAKDLAGLLEDAFHSKRLADDLGMRIARKSDGNPFFVFEIVRGLREGQFIAQRADGTWVTTQVIDDIQVPSSVLDLVKARISGLSEEERDLLDLASCCGFEFDPVLIASAGAVARIPALKRFAQIERRHRLVKAFGPRYAFDHHQVQEALYSSLPEALRREYHSVIAEALEPSSTAGEDPSPEIDGVRCVELCTHHLKGVAPARALAYLDGALAHFELGYQNDRAIALADRALEAPDVLEGKPRAEVLLRKAHRLDLLGRRREQGEAIDEAVRCADESESVELSMLLHRARGVLHYRLAQYAEAGEHYEKSGALARELGDRRGEAVAAGGEGLVFIGLGRFDEARAKFERSLDIAREIGAPRIEANATGNLGNVLSFQGHPEEAQGYYERWLELSSEIGDRQGIANATGNVGLALRARGRREEARPQLERSRTIAREIGDRLVEAHAAGNLGNLATDVGDYASALEEFEQCLAILREVGDRQGEAISLGSLGNLYLALGSYAQAREQHERHLVLAREVGNRQEEGYALYVLGLVAEREGDPARAEAALLESLAVSRANAHVVGIAGVQAALARVLRKDDKERAEGARQEALELAREHDLIETLLLVTTEFAAEEGGDVPIAVETHRLHGENVGISWRMAACYRLWQATGEQSYLDQARRLLDELVEHAPEAYRRSIQENVALHRDILAASDKLAPDV